MFEFIDFDLLTDDVIDLLIEKKTPSNEEKGYVPAYFYKIALHNAAEKIGEISIRIGDNINTFYGGHIGYEVYKEFRGKRYAARACAIIKQVALEHGMKRIIITCNPENVASRRTCEIFGARLIEIVDLPEDNEMYLEGERKKCRYEMLL